MPTAHRLRQSAVGAQNLDTSRKTARREQTKPNLAEGGNNEVRHQPMLGPEKLKSPQLNKLLQKQRRSLLRIPDPIA